MKSYEKGLLSYGWLMYLKGYQKSSNSDSLNSELRDELFDDFICEQDVKFIDVQRKEIEI